jgi:hypothetical protein
MNASPVAVSGNTILDQSKRANNVATNTNALFVEKSSIGNTPGREGLIGLTKY